MEGELPLSKDVLIEILIYLPVKSLMRFRCVSNNWFALIKSETFVSKHLRRDGMETLLLKRSLPARSGNEILRDRKTLLSFHDPGSPELLVLPNLSVPFLDDTVSHEYINLFGPCNGLICLVYVDVIIMCNPALREFELLAPTPFAYPEEYVDISLASGFGFDAKTNSYKLVQFWNIVEREADYPYDDSYMRIDLYNSKTNSWRQIDDVVVPRVLNNIGFDLLFNGSFHWQAGVYIDGPPPKGVILSFDMSIEVFKELEFPHWFEDDKHPSLMVLNQCLALVRYGGWQSVEPDLVDIWVMKKYGIEESWTKTLVIGPYVFRYPFVSWKDEWIVVETKAQLALCALHANECRIFQFHGCEGSLKALIFMESLISLKEALYGKEISHDYFDI